MHTSKAVVDEATESWGASCVAKLEIVSFAKLNSYGDLTV